MPVVYVDNTVKQLMDAFESFAVISTESMQHQVFIEVANTFTLMFCRLAPEQQRRVEDIVLRILSGLSDHVLTAELEASLEALSNRLRAADRFVTAAAVDTALQKLRRSVGKLNSRSTRGGAAC